MRCSKCNKPISNMATICPYCSTPVEHKEEISFGDISEINYIERNDIKTYFDEPKDKKSISLAFILIFVVIGVFLVLIFSMFKTEEENGSKYFDETVDNIFKFFDDNYVNNKTLSVLYDLDLSINGEKQKINGLYERDTNKNIFKLTGDITNSDNGIVVDPYTSSFNVYLEKNNLYLKSDKLTNGDNILFNLNGNVNFLNGSYESSILLKGIKEGIKESLKNVTFNISTESINYRGLKTSTKKYYFMLDNKGKCEFIKNFIDKLISNDEFMSEYAKLSNLDTSELVKKLEDLKTCSIEEDSNYKLIFTIYTDGKNILRYFIDVNENDLRKTYQLDIKDKVYYFDYSVNDKNEISATLTKKQENNDKNNITYYITFDTDNYVTDITLNIKIQNISEIKQEEYVDYINANDLDENVLNDIKNKFEMYIKNVELIDKVINNQ